MRKLPSGNWNTTVKVNGKQISVTAKTKAECEYLASQYKTQRKKKSGLTVRDCVEKYIKMSEILSETTLDSYEKILRYAFQDFLDKPIDELDNATVQMAINAESRRMAERTHKQISPKTVKNEWGLISAALHVVAGRSFLVKLPTVQHKNITLPEPELIIKAVKGTDAELPTLLAMWCGLRTSEIRGLTYGSIHEDYISVDKVMVDAYGRSIHKDIAKTDSSIRKVPMPNYIKELIKAQDKPKNALVVPLTRNVIYDNFTKAMKKEGCEISFHALRHEYASILLTKLKLSEKVVQKSGGWATTNVMKTVYSNTFSDSDIEAARIRDSYFESFLL